MRVPFLDLKAQYKPIQEEIKEEIQKVIDVTAFAGGPFVEKFENEFAAACSCKYAMGVGNGTEALWLALLALGIGEGHEVITTPNTFIATAEAISFCGAQPVFVDVDEETYNINPDLIASAITPRTKAIIPVHLFGQMSNMDPIMEIAKAHDLSVIEDASQAHLAEYKGRRAGSIGDIGCFSFYPGKNLGAFGEAGAVVTNDPEIAHKIRILRDHGQQKKYHHNFIGWNARMDGIQGAVLSINLKYIESWNENRRKNAQIYNKLLANFAELILPKEADYAKHIYHIYAVRTQNRDDFIKQLAERNISSGIHYPVPIHLTHAYKFLGLGKGTYSISEKYAEQLVSLPMFPTLNEEQIEYVANEIRAVLSKQVVYT